MDQHLQVQPVRRLYLRERAVLPAVNRLIRHEIQRIALHGQCLNIRNRLLFPEQSGILHVQDLLRFTVLQTI